MARALKDTNRLDEDSCSLGKLKEILCPDTEDLDDPIYKIIKYKNEKINDFLDKQLSDKIDKDIYRHLIKFFSRYFRNGMISINRYFLLNDGDVCFHWSNKDQYYVKSMEYFKKYGFKVKDLNVNFRIVKAQLEKGNSKPNEKKFFVLNEKIFDFDEDKNELNIYFDYRALTDEEKEKFKSKSQTKINKEIVKVLDEKIPKNSLARLIFEKEGNKTIIEKHINKYTKRNVIDYFIHKDLKGFLERELDFYIKNEFIKIDSLDNIDLNKIKNFRSIALKIIDCLAQIENFQKKIWEKKKFVIDTHYVITLDKVKEYAGEEFLESILEEVLKNKKQLDEWKELFGIEVKNKKDLIERNTLDGKEWKKLPIDTKYFDEEFKWKLLTALSKNNDLDEILDGILIKSENFQALNLLLNKYYEKVQTIYIDPPFNTGRDFLYKDKYRNSTWLTLMENRLKLSKYLLKEDGNIFVHLDDNADYFGRYLMNLVFGEDNFLSRITNFLGYNTKREIRPRKFVEQDEIILHYSKSNNYKFIKLAQIKQKYLVGKNNKNIRNKYYDFLKTIIREDKYLDFFDDSLFPAYSIDLIVETEEEGNATKVKHLLIPFWENGTFKLIQPFKEVEIRNGLDSDKYFINIIGNVWTDVLSLRYSAINYNEGVHFETQKLEKLIFRIVLSTTDINDVVLDFFLGSGTTTAVAHKLRRKWIGVEIGEHFWTVVLPRMKRVLSGEQSGISKKINWKGGGFFKYHTLEQYEDALENIEFEEKQKTLDEFSDYFVKYMLEWETKNSKTFLNIDEMKDPFNYKLKIIENYQQKIVNVDLIETFNYLLGIHVQGYKVLNENNRKYVIVFGKKDGKKIAIVWRSIKDIDFKKDKKVIEREIKEFCPDEIYINGDALVKGFKSIEPIFKSLMFS